jgi:hypothetical protein
MEDGDESKRNDVVRDGISSGGDVAIGGGGVIAVVKDILVLADKDGTANADTGIGAGVGGAVQPTPTDGVGAGRPSIQRMEAFALTRFAHGWAAARRMAKSNDLTTSDVELSDLVKGKLKEMYQEGITGTRVTPGTALDRLRRDLFNFELPTVEQIHTYFGYLAQHEKQKALAKAKAEAKKKKEATAQAAATAVLSGDSGGPAGAAASSNVIDNISGQSGADAEGRAAAPSNRGAQRRRGRGGRGRTG